MAIRVGINGFGRIGRLALRAAWGREDLEFGLINEKAGDGTVSAHLLEFDSVHGRWPHAVSGEADRIRIAPSTLVINGTQVKVLAWYDNEWGYANRLVELVGQIGRSL
jgi:glyceraldehyde 3-phosphate dehydrogenase